MLFVNDDYHQKNKNYARFFDDYSIVTLLINVIIIDLINMLCLDAVILKIRMIPNLDSYGLEKGGPNLDIKL